jgi:hypothetical protein
MVPEVLPDTRKITHDRDAESLKMITGANPRSH